MCKTTHNSHVHAHRIAGASYENADAAVNAVSMNKMVKAEADIHRNLSLVCVFSENRMLYTSSLWLVC